MTKMVSFRHFIGSWDMSLIPTVIAVTLTLLSIIYYWNKNRGVMPGPKGLPYLGLFPFLKDENAITKLEEYKKKYGDMFSFTYTGRLFVNLGSIKAMREIQLHKSDCFADRFKNSGLLIQMINNGIFSVNGEPWKILRKFFIQKFKDYGLNTVRSDLAGPIYDSLNSAIEGLKTQHEKPINIVDFLSQHCSISMRKILFGEKGVTDQEISQMLIAFSESSEGQFCVNNFLCGPVARFLFATKSTFQKNLQSSIAMKSIILKCIKRIESSMTEDEPSCIVEEFYKERNERRRKNDTTWKFFSDEALVDSLYQFVGDGIGSVAAFIAGVLNILLDHPKEQETLYSEIMEVVGPNRQPAAEDRPHMPYTNAVLNEYCRTSKFLTLFPSLECTKETTVRGYRIPVGTITVLNFWSANHDPETYENPYTFNPSRFLATEGKSKVESPILFGMGKRVCTGEPFVMLQAFLFLTTIVKHFKLVSSNIPEDKSADFLLKGKLELTFVPRKGI